MKNKWPSLCIVVTLVSLSPGCRRQPTPAAAATVRAPASAPNILLISVDMLRPDHLAGYGYNRVTSPNIDGLIRDGAVFENAVSSTSWTLPSHAALMTGLVDTVHQCTDTDRRLSENRRTMAERLQAVGYATAGFFSGPYLHPVFGLAQGFTEYVDCTSYSKLNNKTVKLVGTVEGPAIWDASHKDITNPRITQSVENWLAKNHQTPFFLFVHMWDVHYDFIPPKEHAERFDPDYDGPVDGDHFLFNQWINARMPERDLQHLLALYDGEISWTDEHIGRILRALESQGLTETTVIALVADHGTEFFEHGDKSHRKTLFDEVIRIPLVIRYPQKLPAGTRIAEQVRIIDVMPTLLELAGFPVPTDVMGQSLLPLVNGDSLAEDNLAISELYSAGRRMRSFRRSDRKTIVDELTNRTWIYDLANDPQELNPITDKDHPLVHASKRDVELGTKWIADFGQTRPAADSDSTIPPKLLEKLRSLGYVSDHESTSR